MDEIKRKYRGTIFIRGFYCYSLLKRMERCEEELLLITNDLEGGTRSGEPE